MQLLTLNDLDLSSRRCGQSRCAMTLVEVMVAMVIASILLGVVVSFAVELFKLDRCFRDHGVHNDQIIELANSIRSDIRKAEEVTVPAKDILVITASDNGRTRYELKPVSCQRIAIVAGDGTERESSSFTIGSAKAWRIEQNVSDRRPLINVWLEEFYPDKSPSSPGWLFVCAELGADRTSPAKTDVGGAP